MEITVECRINAPMAAVWKAWTSPEDIMQWNAASDDWHTTAATVDLRPGGRFCWRMEAKDGKAGFDFEGEYLEIRPEESVTAEFGGRKLRIVFIPDGDAVLVRETFDAEDEYPLEDQREGWQAILDRFKSHVEAGGGRGAAQS